MEDKIALNYENILKYTRNSIEYLFVDKAEVIPGKMAEGVKLLSSQDWFFKVHFPGNPIMPGVLIMESIMTTGACILTTLPEKQDLSLLFNGCDHMRLYQSVRPGDILKTRVELISYKYGIAKFEGMAFVENVKVCSMNFTLVAPDEVIHI